ncbi:nitroreductase family protein [Nocardia sp. CDC160]|uniref:nitroreductase family protein n=1 Tax=Nocardia sp. CDC160 TaxID=3112166 RepID=UPI002DBD6068|nr:nitroreductase family protein [Nocardia sp. CDC160]MEC3916233.1 nitroreductase family protein [Nocardia sp. CDC160]
MRHFRADPVPREVVEEIIEVARWTGSARNRQPWRFVAVSAPQVRERLSGFGGYALHLANAPLVLVLASHDNGFADTEFDMGRLAQSVCLAAAHHGLGTCVTTFHPANNIHRAADLLALPSDWLPRHAIAMGYPAPTKPTAPTAIPRGRKSVPELLTWVQ